MHIRVDDIVEVIAGEDKVRGKVLRVLREENRVIVEGVNRVYRLDRTDYIGGGL